MSSSRSLLPELSPIGRILLVTDGTLVDILQAYTLEPIQLVSIDQHGTTAHPAMPLLELSDGEPALRREITLRGCTSGTTYVHAESLLALDRLDPEFRSAIAAREEPIGQLWSRLRIETYKEIVHCGRRPAGALSHHFGTSAEDPLVFRSYRVFCQKRPVMFIEESFRERWPDAR